MEQMGVGLQALAISGLEGAQFRGLSLTGIDREGFIEEEIPNFLAARAGVERFILSVTDPAELRIGLRRFGAIAIADDLEDPFALIDLLAQHRAQVAGLGAENILPDRLVTEEAERIRGELATAPQLTANCGNENQRKRSHGA